MNRLSCLIALLTLLIFTRLDATLAETQSLEKSYQLALDKWSLEIRIATTAEDRLKILDKRPDASPFARKIWASISSSLNEEWTLEPVAWFLRTTPGLHAIDSSGTAAPIFTQENDAIYKAIETYHLKSPKLIPICFALAFSPSPRSLAVLEKIQTSNPDLKTQGVAALGVAMQLKALGSEGEIMGKRLTRLRKAIIQSADVQIGDTTVAKLAEDELYIIQFLSRGRVAPNLVGVDSGNRPLSLAAHPDKIIVLLFWNSEIDDAKRILQITSALQTKFKGRALAILGVNNDPVEKLRALQADNTITWPNFSDPENKLAKQYRIGNWPLVYVLDAERKIHYTGAPGSFVEFTVEALLSELKPTAK